MRWPGKTASFPKTSQRGSMEFLAIITRLMTPPPNGSHLAPPLKMCLDPIPLDSPLLDPPLLSPNPWIKVMNGTNSLIIEVKRGAGVPTELFEEPTLAVVHVTLGITPLGVTAGAGGIIRDPLGAMTRANLPPKLSSQEGKTLYPEYLNSRFSG